LFLTSTINTYNLKGWEIVTEAEYMVLDWLSKNKADGRVLGSWDRGYMIKALSGLDAVSTPQIVDYKVHNLLWLPARQSALELRRQNIRYVFMTGHNFEVVKDSGNTGYAMQGGLVRVPSYLLKPEATNIYTIYQLRYGIVDGYFMPLLHVIDNATKLDVMLYEVLEEQHEIYKNSAIVGVILKNNGEDKTVLVNATAEIGGKTLGGLNPENLVGGEVKAITYGVGPNPVLFNCTVDVSDRSVEVLTVFCGGYVAY
ncbi:MAG: hypothetical protein KKD39_04900, partial [Candidatus Altiarchaeota archaeon]|nr:hypothetical protein [Candidatus Altiarchaeota archaeon]